MKKLYPIFLIVILVALAVGVTYWRGQGETSLPFARPVSDTQNQASSSNWQDYKSEKYGFELKMPTGWKVEETSVGLNFLSPENQEYIKENAKNCSAEPQQNCNAEIFSNVYFYNNFDDKDIADTRTESINEVQFFRYAELYSMISPVGYKTEKNGKIYNFQVPFPEGENLLRQILSTFRFLDTAPVSTADWRVDRNEAYGFEIKLPKGFSIDSQGTGYAGDLPGPILYMLINENREECETKNQNKICQFEVKPFLTLESKKRYKDLSEFIDSYRSLNELVGSPRKIILPTGTPAINYENDNDYIIEGDVYIYLFSNRNGIDYYQDIVNSFRLIN